MNRRRLFKTLGAAVVVAPVAMIAASEPVKAEPIITPELMAEITENRGHIARSEGYSMGRADERERTQDLIEDRYQAGLTDGLHAVVDRFYRQDLTFVSIAAAQGKVIARTDTPESETEWFAFDGDVLKPIVLKPNSIFPLVGRPLPVVQD